MPVIGEHADHRQAVPAADLEVVRVVRGGDLDDAGALGHVGMLVAHDRDLAPDQRQDHMAAVKMSIPLVLRVDRDGGIAEHRFRAGGGQLQLFARFLDGVQQMPEVAVFRFVLHLGIRDGGAAVRTPVDQPVAAVDQPLLVQADEHLLDRAGAALVHRETLALPVAGRADRLELADDAAAVFLAPCPCPLKEPVAPDGFFRQAIGAHGLDHLRLRRDGGVIRAGHPQRFIPLHPAVAGEDILQGVVQRMPHVQLAGDVGGRHHDGVRLFFAAVGRLGVGDGMEIAARLPHIVDAFFHLARVIHLCKLFSFCHGSTSFRVGWGQWMRLPGVMSSTNSTCTSALPSGFLPSAAKIMPLLSTPQSVAGARFATKTTRRPIRSAG